jgi:hypothetical protein
MNSRRWTSTTVRNRATNVPVAEDPELDARLRRELAEVGRSNFFEAVKYSRQQRADLLQIADDIQRARKDAARPARKTASG